MDLLNIIKDDYKSDPLSTIIMIGLFGVAFAFLFYIIASMYVAAF